MLLGTNDPWYAANLVEPPLAQEDVPETATQVSTPVSFVNVKAVNATFPATDPGHVFDDEHDAAMPSSVSEPVCCVADWVRSPQKGPTGIAPESGAAWMATVMRTAAQFRTDRRVKTI
jgi:hypothetical protein